jgi:hypothetical protein
VGIRERRALRALTLWIGFEASEGMPGQTSSNSGS